MEIENYPQRVENVNLYPPELELDPSSVRRLYLDNTIQRSLALISAIAADGQHVLACTPTGELKTVSSGSGYTEYDSLAGSAPDAYNSTHTLTFSGSHWTILVETNEAEIHFRNAVDTAYLDSIPLTLGYHCFDFSSSSIQIKNRVPGSVADYTIIGWR